MNLIQNNPYRTVGVLVGATAKEQTKQIKQLKMYLEAEQEPKDDFSFSALGNLHRTLDSVEDAASKLNLDSDKINAALFWFYKGYAITDEPAFEAIKEGDLDQVLILWTKLANNGEVSQRNASAYSNLSTLYLSGVLDGTNTDEAILEQGVSLKLKFLESDFANDLKALATDETYKTTKKELQLLFLNQLHSEIERTKKTSLPKFLEILNKQAFTAKADFLKGFVQKPIEQIEQKIETAKNKRKANKANAAKAGQELFTTTANDLTQLKSIVGTSDIKYTSVADKVANEILQCSIDYFNDSQEKNSSSDYTETAMKLAKKAETIAVGNLTKDRVKDSINTLAEMKNREISQAIEVLKSIKDAYEENKRKITQQAMAQEEKLLKVGRKINWGAVNSMIEESLNWQEAALLVQKIITPRKIEEIKKSSNEREIILYKNLVNFFLGKISNKNLKYLKYWKSKTKEKIHNIVSFIYWMIFVIVMCIIILYWWSEGGKSIGWTMLLAISVGPILLGIAGLIKEYIIDKIFNY